MKYNTQTIREEYRRLDHILGIDTENISITVSTRATNRLGLCKYKGNKPVEICITDFILDCEDQFWDTIRHEYAHAAAILMDGKNHGHDDYWKRICRRVGCDPERCAKYDGELKQAVEASGRKREYKYRMSCPVCGRSWMYKSAGKFVRYIRTGQGNRMRCPCGAKGDCFQLESI